jgi:hypothetical protein
MFGTANIALHAVPINADLTNLDPVQGHKHRNIARPVGCGVFSSRDGGSTSIKGSDQDHLGGR